MIRRRFLSTVGALIATSTIGSKSVSAGENECDDSVEKDAGLERKFTGHDEVTGKYKGYARAYGVLPRGSSDADDISKVAVIFTDDDGESVTAKTVDREELEPTDDDTFTLRAEIETHADLVRQIEDAELHVYLQA